MQLDIESNLVSPVEFFVPLLLFNRLQELAIEGWACEHIRVHTVITDVLTRPFNTWPFTTLEIIDNEITNYLRANLNEDEIEPVKAMQTFFRVHTRIRKQKFYAVNG